MENKPNSHKDKIPIAVVKKKKDPEADQEGLQRFLLDRELRALMHSFADN